MGKDLLLFSKRIEVDFLAKYSAFTEPMNLLRHFRFMQSLPRPQILIIDDQPDSLAELTATLEAHNYNVAISVTGKQGFCRAQALRPSLILLDVEMPHADGFATLTLLKEAPETSKIPVIFLTSNNEMEYRLKGLEMGAYDYIAKPFNCAEVLARVKIHIALNKQSRRSQSDVNLTEEVLSMDEVLLQAAQRVMRDNLDKDLTLSEIANEVGTYDKKLSRIFREFLGVTVFSWLREERINKAKGWLVNTNMEIQDIAQELGYATPANFATYFKQLTGLTPSEYRIKLRAKHGLN